jgi:hypothetical protein
MGLCMKASCTVNNLCKKCRRDNPATALQNDRDRRERRGGGNRSGGVGRVVGGIVTAATAFGGMTAEPPVDQIHNASDAYERSRSSLVDNRDEYLDEQTRAAGDRRSGSSEPR